LESSSFESYEFVYDGAGLLAVFGADTNEQWEHTSEQEEVYHRGDSGIDHDEIDRLEDEQRRTEALRVAKPQMADAVMEWARRVAPVDTVIIGMLFMPYTTFQVPPFLGALTQRQLERWQATTDHQTLRRLVWSPTEYEVFDVEPRELCSDDDLGKALKLLGCSWGEYDDNDSARKLMRWVAKELRKADWNTVFERTPVIFAIDHEMMDLDYVRRTAVDAKLRKQLESE
jgi:hypothetical protein